MDDRFEALRAWVEANFTDLHIGLLNGSDLVYSFWMRYAEACRWRSYRAITAVETAHMELVADREGK